MIPALDMRTGLLPAGIHQATLDEVREVFVDQAPHPEDRGLIFEVLELWCRRAERILGHGRLWVDGGFVTYKDQPPHDADLVLLLDDPDTFMRSYAQSPADVLGLLTLQGVLWEHPLGGHVPRVQPMGGLIDAFVIDPRQGIAVDYWRETWSHVKLPDGTLSETMEKGFVEVTI